MALGIAVSDVFNTLQVYLGSFYINNFNAFGRTWQVNVQADQRFRNNVTDIGQLQVRNAAGNMVRLGTLVANDPEQVQRTKRVIQRVWRAIESRHVYPSPSPINCPTCPYRAACRAWQG